ncbi:RdRP-domain-containing protein [Fistulina hepatica ATCC 64428]|nr:RdRP-domain-containing protein [Fistulina hepatica ATCC 64428]
MNIEIKGLPVTANHWDVTRAIADVLHTPEFDPRLADKSIHPKDLKKYRINFEVNLNRSKQGKYTRGVRNDGTGYFTLPDEKYGKHFVQTCRATPIVMTDDFGKKHKVTFFPSKRPVPKGKASTLQRTPYVDPDVEEEHEKKVFDLELSLRVDLIRFGIFYRPFYYNSPRSHLGRAFSAEWDKPCIEEVAWLRFEYDHKLIRVGNQSTDEFGSTIAIRFASIQKIAICVEGKTFLYFDLLTPPIFERLQFHRTEVPGPNAPKFKWRVRCLEEGHARVSDYASQLCIVLTDKDETTEETNAKRFLDLCRTAEINNLVACYPVIDSGKHEFFSPKKIDKLRKQFREFDWAIAFQLEALLRNGLVNTWDLEWLLVPINELCKDSSQDTTSRVSQTLKRYTEALLSRDNQESPVECFDRVVREFRYSKPYLSPNTFLCHHVTFTPTRTILEGPYPIQSNRIIRQYPGHEHNFIRVDFRDEDRLMYRWDRNVDGAMFVQERVGGILKEGFELGGRYFEFLAYSSSALREHSVWFMSRFKFPVQMDGKIGVIWITAQGIRDEIGRFENTKLLKQPSKYAARLAQAFTATDSSVTIRRNEWEEVADIQDMQDEPNLFTDGVGTISQSLADEISAELCKSRSDGGLNYVKPSAYQIRFLGYKGVVSVDDELDNHPNGIRMRLRPSMHKFNHKLEESGPDSVADIEIAKAFNSATTSFTNKCLEDLGVDIRTFLDLQSDANAHARSIHDSLEDFRSRLKEAGLGRPFHLSFIIEKLQCLGLDIKGGPRPNIDNPFFTRLRDVTMITILRDIKHRARIPMKNAYHVVGVVDEGRAYEMRGYDNVFCLPEDYICVCIQRPGKEPEWLEGDCLVSRSPITHPGDIQKVTAMKPPEGMRCTFASLRNVVVFPCCGERSLPSMLAGGDLDGDEYDVIFDDQLLTRLDADPLSYKGAGVCTLDRDTTVDDVCDFIVEYINSDVLGLLSDRLLVIADQSQEGIFDPDCVKLAEMCSQAVDYPKQGIPVKIDDLPNTLIRCKPDWHAAEVVFPRKNDYYVSYRALGELFRQINIEDIPSLEPVPASSSSEQAIDIRDDIISMTLMPHLDPETISANDFRAHVENMFKRYTDEMRYICTTHTLSNTPGVRLLEEEVVVGTILAKCSQTRWRQDRTSRMRLHAFMLVDGLQRELVVKDKPSDEELVFGIRRAWQCWKFSLEKADQWGAKSFGLMALGIVLDCLDKQGCIPQLMALDT